MVDMTDALEDKDGLDDMDGGGGGLKDFLRRRINEFLGAALFMAAVFLLLIFATYDPTDPSFNVATEKVPVNMGGAIGSAIADLMLQYVGLAAYLFPLVMMVWATKLLMNLPVRKLWLRLMVLPFILLAASASLGILGDPGAFGIHGGAGGAIGSILFGTGHVLAHMVPALAHAAPLVAAGFAAVASGLLLYVLGLTPGEWRGVRRKAFKAAMVSGSGTQVVAKTGWTLGLKGWRWGRRVAEDHGYQLPGLGINRPPREPAIRPRPVAQRPVTQPNAAGRPEVAPTASGGAQLYGRSAMAPEMPMPRADHQMPQAPMAPYQSPRVEPVAPRNGVRVEPGFAPPPPRRPADMTEAPPWEDDDQSEPAVTPSPEMAPRRNLTGIVAPKHNAPVPGRRAEELRQPSFDLDPHDDYELPPLTLLAEPAVNRSAGPTEEALQQNALLLLGVLEDFGVRGEIVKVRPGPVVTLYELEPAPGTKSSRVIGLADDIARSMSAVSVRVAVVPGRNVIGIELPNAKSETVYLRELLASDAYERVASKLALVLGKDIGGAPVIADLAKMPHLLIAGTTGSGKSVGINTMILSILYKLPPDQCKFIMIDPKMLELSIYEGIPHLLAPVVTDPKKAVVALKWTVREMENRYRLMSKLGVRNIDGYNTRVMEAAAKGETLTRRVQTGFDAETGEPHFEEQPLDNTPLPFIVVVVDEMADLMLVAGKDIEAAIQRLAQMARAAGIHIIMATQRPSVDVITGTIKANFPTRISFQVTSKIDSRTILGEAGAEQLLGRGDMLYMAGGGRITRVHGPFVADREVEDIVNFLKSQAAPSYIEEVTDDSEAEGGGGGGAIGGDDEGGGSDDLYDRAVALVTRERKASTSFVQRHLQIGYNRAARIVERMEQEGVVSAANHVGKREILAPPPPR